MVGDRRPVQTLRCLGAEELPRSADHSHLRHRRLLVLTTQHLGYPGEIARQVAGDIDAVAGRIGKDARQPYHIAGKQFQIVFSKADAASKCSQEVTLSVLSEVSGSAAAASSLFMRRPTHSSSRGGP